MSLFKNHSLTSKLIVLMFIYGYCSIWNQVLTLAFTPSWSKGIISTAYLYPTTLTTYFPLPSFSYSATRVLYLTSAQAWFIVPDCFYVILCPIKNIIWVELDVCAYLLFTSTNYAGALRRCGYKFIFESNPLWPYIHDTQLLLLMMIFKSLCILFYWILLFWAW